MKLINKIFQLILLPLIIAGAFFVWSLPRITTDYNFNSDELIYLSRSNYWDAFKSGDFKNPIWSAWGSYDQPQLTNYIYAAVPGDRELLEAKNSPCPQANNNSFFNAWSCLDGPPLNTWNDKLGEVKTMAVKARLLGTGISSLVLATTYYLGLMVAGPVAGVLAALFLGWFSFFKNLGTMAMMDQILLVFLNLQLIATMIILKSKSKNFFGIFLLTLVTGLAMSTKLSAIIPTTINYAFLAYQSLKNKHIRFSSLIVSTILAVTLFVSLHPNTWSDPVGSVAKMVTWRTTQIAEQKSLDYIPVSIADKTTYTINEVFSSWKSGVEPTTIATIAVICLISFLYLIINRTNFAVLSSLNVLAFVLILPLKWNRYLLPILPAISLYFGSISAVITSVINIVRKNFHEIIHFSYGAIFALTMISPFAFISPSDWLGFAVLFITILLIIQGYLVTKAMLHGFTERNVDIAESVHIPTKTFSLIVPARNEEAVIGNTIASIGSLNYPKELYEALIIIRADDYGTILAAQSAIDSNNLSNVKIVQIDGEAENKAYSLNIGLKLAKYEIVGIFDAEDEPSKDILQKVNEYFLDHAEVGVVQAPVHLTNVASSWFASLNSVEYFYWFRSVLPYLAGKNIVPLGGNTIFTKKSVYDQVGHYDENCLTEDADFGIRLGEKNIKVGVISDPRYATCEEVPLGESEVIRQRSRWDQGYFQVLEKSHWKNLDSTQKFYALYTLTQPLFRHLSFLNMIFAPLLSSFGHIPFWIVLLSFVPGYFLLIQFGLYLLGLNELGKLHNLKISFWRYLSTILSFVPYQALLALATFRAMTRFVSGNFAWDKTEHANSHRSDLAILKE